MCTVLLPPGDNPIAVNKYEYINIKKMIECLKSFIMMHKRLVSTYRVSQEEWTKLRESVPYVKIYRYNPEHLYPTLNVYGDNGHRSLKV